MALHKHEPTTQQKLWLNSVGRLVVVIWTMFCCSVKWSEWATPRLSGKHCGLARPPNSPALHLLPCDHHDHHGECGGRNNGLPFSASFMFFLNLCSCFHLYFYLYAYLSGLCLSALTSEECGKQEEEAKTCLSIIESHNHSPKLPTRFLPFFQLLREDICSKKTFSFGHCPNVGGGGGYPCPNFLALFSTMFSLIF